MRILVLFIAAVIAGGAPQENHPDPAKAAWVADALKQMLTVKPGMTRAQLLTVFTTEGGLSTRLERTYVSRECPYFKVRVEFAAVAGAARDAQGRLSIEEDARDIVKSISKPFLEFSVVD